MSITLLKLVPFTPTLIGKQISRIGYPDLIQPCWITGLFEQIGTVAKPVVTVRAKWLETLFLYTGNGHLVHQAKRTIPAAVNAFIFEVMVDRTVAVTPFCLVVDTHYVFLDLGIFKTAR